jgi:hypothetical protein
VYTVALPSGTDNFFLFPLIGPVNGVLNDFHTAPHNFHEILCRASFKENPTSGKGCRAQRALLHGGTILNGKVSVQVRHDHGRAVRELVCLKDVPPLEVVTCYGGFVGLAPAEKDEHTHMRHIPASGYVMDGDAFSSTMPEGNSAVSKLGVKIPLYPRCDDEKWASVVAGSGIGYMANTVTKCPLQGQKGYNVTVHAYTLGRVVPGVVQSDVLVLQACIHGLKAGDCVISPYESYRQTKKFQFVCADLMHYRAAGATPPDHLLDLSASDSAD